MRRYIISILIVTVLLSSFGCMRHKEYQLLELENRRDAEDWLMAGDLLYELGEYSDAIDYYERIITVYPDSSYAQAAQARLVKAQKKYLKNIEKHKWQ